MSQRDKILLRILTGNSDVNIPFEQLCQFLVNLGFNKRIQGSHHIFSMEGI